MKHKASSSAAGADGFAEVIATLSWDALFRQTAPFDKSYAEQNSIIFVAVDAVELLLYCASCSFFELWDSCVRSVVSTDARIQ